MKFHISGVSSGALLLGLTFISGLRANAAVFTVTTTADSGTGSLRNCIRQANKTPEQDRILFSLPAAEKQDGKWTIDLLSPLQGITTPMRIVGPGSGKLTIRPGDGSGIGEIFDFRSPDSTVVNPIPGFELYLAGMTLDGSPTGATGVFLWHQKGTLQDCVITGATGSGIVNAGGGVTANSCRFEGNSAM